MKYIRLYEQRLQDFEILTNPDTQMLIDELRKEIKKEDSDLDYIKDLVFYGHFDIDVIWEMRGEQWTFLQKAAELNIPDIVKVLLEEGADPNVQNKYGSTALHKASIWGHLQVVRELLKHPNINPNIQNRLGTTALHLASYRGYSQAVQALLSHPKTDITITNDDDETAWDLATDEIREEFPELNPNRSKR